MKKIVLIVLLAVSSIAYSSDWDSPIDIKYKQKSHNLFEKFNKVRDILNSWGGQREKLIEADKLLKEIIIQDSEYAPAYREYGRLYIMAGYVNNQNFKKGSLNPSEAYILKSIDIEPNYADSFVLLGHLYTKMKRYNEAKIALEKAEAIGTKISWLDLNWADLLNSQGKPNEAFQRYKKIVKENTSNKKAYSKALSGITKHYQSRGDYEQTKLSYIKEIEYDPEDAWIRGNYSSFLLFLYGDVDGAIESGEEALQIMDYGMGRFHLACAFFTKWAILRNSTSKENSQKYFDQAWKLYPYPEKVIEETKRFKNTIATARALKQWQSKH